MTSSGTTIGTMSAQEVVQASAEELGVVAAGETVTGDELEMGLRALNFMLKSFTARGVNLWREEVISFSVPAGQAATALPVMVEDVLAARYVQSAAFERPLIRYTRGRYMDLPYKASTGAPLGFYVDRQRDGAMLYLWPAPIAATTLKLDVTRAIEDVTTGDQTLDVPAKWMETVYIALAARLATPFGVTRTDPATASRIAQRAQALEQLLLDDDRPESVFMGTYGAGR